MSAKSKGMMFVLSSPSGAGKTTLTKKLAENNSNFVISISCTTREPRPYEEDGRDYHFIDKKNYELLVKKKSFFECAKIFGNYYGTLREPVLKLLSEGKDVLFDIDWQGTKQLKKISDLNIVTFFIIPPDIRTLTNRLLRRHERNQELVEERMKQFKEEISHWNEYDWIVVNDRLEICYENLKKIIFREKKGIRDRQDKKSVIKQINKLTK